MIPHRLGNSFLKQLSIVSCASPARAGIHTGPALLQVEDTLALEGVPVLSNVVSPDRFAYLEGQALADLDFFGHLHEEHESAIYAWLGGAIGKEQKKLRSIHDVSDGGLMTAIAESCVAITEIPAAHHGIDRLARK